MEGSFIQQIQPWNNIGVTEGGTFRPEKTENAGFQGIFREAVRDVKSTEENLVEQQFLLATGQTEDAHSVMIAASEAQMAVDLLVSLRNKALDSYNELMRISL